MRCGRSGLQHYRVSVNEGRCHLPDRNRDWEVPRGDKADHAERHSVRVQQDVGVYGRDDGADRVRAFDPVVLQQRDRPADFTARLEDCLARFPGDGLCILLEIVFEIGSGLEQVAAPDQRRSATPAFFSV